MKHLARRILLLTLGTGVISACTDRSPESAAAEADAAASATVPSQNDAPERVITVTGGGPVIQVLPGPAQFADSARRVVEQMPADIQQMMTMMGQNGPFSDKVAVVSGTLNATYWDRGARGDTMLTSDTRGDDFAYQCWDCTARPIEQFHLMLMPVDMKTPYAVPGGVLHVMWEKSTSRSGA